MATMFSMHKAERTKMRRLPYLPRIGVVVEFAGRKMTFKHAPFLETAMNLKDRGFSLKNLRSVMADELHEIKFPAMLDRGLATVKAFKPKAAEAAKSVRKAAAKVAAKKKETEATV